MVTDSETEAKKTASSFITTIEILFKDLPTFFKSYMIHLNQGGLYIKTETPLPLDACVILKITLPESSHLVEARGRVVLSNPYSEKSYFPKGMGIKFTDIKSEDLDRISNLTKNNRARAEDLSIL